MKTIYGSACLVILTIATVALTGCPPTLIPGQTRTFDGIEFQWCPPGTFYMGSPVSEDGRQSDETLHEVTISQGFWLGKYEVTQEQWESLMGSNPALNVGDNHPVERVSRDDAQSFIDALNAATSYSATYRLPTEAEWEYAYRAGTTTRFFWGNDATENAIDEYALYNGNIDFGTEPVGTRRPNNWGLYDISGNVWEWVQDWYGEYPDGPVSDPQGPTSGNVGIVRGGSFLSFPYQCRAAHRFTHPADTPSLMMGFRVLRTVN